MDLMRLFIRLAMIARTRQPTWKIVVIGGVIALVAVSVLVEWAGYWPEGLTADRVRTPRI